MATTGHSLDQGERTPQLRLFTPAELAAADADSPAGLWPGMSLSQFAGAYVLPYWLTERRADQKTIGIYRQALDRWSQLTCDPPLADIDDRTTSQFIAGLSGLPGRKAEQISPATIHKLCRAIQTCLNLAGPKTPQHRKAQRLISDVPYLEKPTLDEPEAGIDDNFELAEIAAILAACASMTTPRRDTYTLRVRGRSITVLGTGIDPPAFWRSLVTFAYNTGERKGALFAVAQPAAAASIIKFPGAIRKGKRKTRIVPLNAAARAAIESIRSNRALLFPWPHSPRHFYTLWGRLLAAAGIPPERRFGLHGLRKAAATEAAAYSPMGAQQIMGHADGTLLERHYVSRRLMRDALERLPQPD